MVQFGRNWAHSIAQIIVINNCSFGWEYDLFSECVSQNIYRRHTHTQQIVELNMKLASAWHLPFSMWYEFLICHLKCTRSSVSFAFEIACFSKVKYVLFERGQHNSSTDKFMDKKFFLTAIFCKLFFPV